MKLHYESPRIAEVFFDMCSSVNSPISLGLWLRYKHREFLSLAKFDINPGDYVSADDFRLDYLCASYLSKYKALETGLDLNHEALQRFNSSERSCLETNDRLRKVRNHQATSVVPDAGSIFHRAQRKIADLLGPFSVFKVDFGVGWGPGATDDISRREAFLDTKMAKVPISCTRYSRPIIRSLIADDLHWSSVILGVTVGDILGPFCFTRDVFRETDCCVIDTVPKNAKTHRVIAKEPRANAFLQKGVGAYFRKRLKRVGINLDDQSANQEGARRAYSDGLATLDLKAASDTVSVELVFELLPIDWAIYLDELRSKKAKMPDGTKVRLEKFSSMGNGFTFELESLIFWALASSVRDARSVKGEVLVYGDDIIVPKIIYHDLVSILGFAGFETNEDKSFYEGPFFESCGEHYFAGENVTPIYQKEAIENAEEHIRAANRLIRYGYRHHRGNRLLQEVKKPWLRLYRTGSAFHRFQIPLGSLGDDGFVVTADYFKGRAQNANFGLSCKVIAQNRQGYPAHDSALLAWTLRRGVITEVPYLGVLYASKSVPNVLLEDTRWVMPTGDFGLEI